MRLAKEQGLSLTGPDGLLKQLTKTVLETALNEAITEHLGYEKASAWNATENWTTPAKRPSARTPDKRPSTPTPMPLSASCSCST